MEITTPDNAGHPQTSVAPGGTQHSTSLLAQRSASTNPSDATGQVGGASPRFYASAQWTADGTSVLVGASDYSVSSFVLPSDLLQHDEGEQPLQLEPQSTARLPEPTQAIASSPFFSLGSPDTQVFLVGCRDHPVQLYHALAGDDSPGPIGSYKLVKKETEAFITPSSLIWPSPGSHFLCGSANRIDYFDVTRAGSDGPVVTVPTIPSRRDVSKGSGVGMKGTVSALAATQPEASGYPLISAGTWTRWAGLYDFLRTGTAVANWSIAGADKSEFQIDLGGRGIVQTIWSPCGRYLLINERHSSGLLVYDVRGAGRLLSILNGRTGNSQQRLACDAFQGSGEGFEIWAGSQDGSLHVWDQVGMSNDVVEPSHSWPAHASPVGSTMVHPSGTVAATCSGGWDHPPDSYTDAAPKNSYHTQICRESSLKIWSIDNAQHWEP